MSEETENYELIDQYLDGRLEGAEKLSFEQRMSNDFDFNELVEAQSLVNEIIIGDELLNIREKIKIDLNSSGKANNTKWIAGGIILILGLVIGYFYFTENTKQIAQPVNKEGIISKDITAVTEFKTVEKSRETEVKPSSSVKSDLMKAATKYQTESKEELPALISTTSSALAINQDNKEIKKEENEVVAPEKETLQTESNSTAVSEPVVIPDDKPKTFQYAPQYDGTWKLPLKENANGHFKIVNKNGNVVFEIGVQNGFPNQWDGSSNKGVEIIPGLYLYNMEYADGKTEYGSLTIIQ